MRAVLRRAPIAASALAHASLVGWLIGGPATPTVEPPAPIAVTLVAEAVPAAEPAAVADAAPAAAAPAAKGALPDPPPLPAAIIAERPPPSRPLVKPMAIPAPVPMLPAEPAHATLAALAPAAGTATAMPGAAVSAGAGAAAEAGSSFHDAAPLAAGNAPPVYPLAARRQGAEGRVILDVAVDAGGRAVDLAIARSSGHRLLDEAALRAVRDWRFSPARRDDRPVAARVQVPVTFRLAAVE